MTAATVIPDPVVEFSQWVPWRDRRSLRTGAPWMGVYLWARFETPPDAEAGRYPALPVQIIYVGEANDIEVRPLGSRRHDHVRKYVREFPDDPDLRLLYLSVGRVAPFRPSDPRCHALRAFTRCLEARIGWEYARQFAERPRLDRKTGKDDFLRE